jgi:uncharacterized protein YcbK (DUF882 family)
MKELTIDSINFRKHPASEEQIANMKKLVAAVNKLQVAYGVQFVVTSGLRSEADQKRINPKAPKSRHLLGLAVDIADKDGKLAEWVKANVPKLEEAGIWVEDLAHTKGWVHFQAVPPRSGNRFFIP